MSKSESNRQLSNRRGRRMISQYYAQRIPADRWESMENCVGITFRPGGFKDNFAAKSILPAGTATMFRLSYEVQPGRKGEPRLHIPVLGIKGRDLPTGGVAYDEQAHCLRVDLSCRPREGGRGSVIDPGRNPSLLETALRIDKACQRTIELGRRLQRHPVYPRVLLGFTESRLPAYRDSVELRSRAARQLGISIHRLGQNGDLLLDKLLRDTWEQAIIPPTDPRNWTETFLVDAALCPFAQGFLRIYEDFSELLGEAVFNPARTLEFEQFANPAITVFRELGLGDSPDFNQPFSDEFVGRMLDSIRCHLGESALLFTETDLLDGLTEPDLPLVTWDSLIPKLRGQLSAHANECCTTADLKSAARRPSDALWLRYACRVQVCRSHRQIDSTPPSGSNLTLRLTSQQHEPQLERAVAC